MRSAGCGRTVFQQHRELVAAQARHAVAVADRGAQDAGDLAQQLIARRMAAGVVDDLEVIQIQIQQRVRHRLSARPHQSGVEPPLELAARDEAGERIVARLTQLLARLVEARGGVVRSPAAAC